MDDGQRVSAIRETMQPFYRYIPRHFAVLARRETHLPAVWLQRMEHVIECFGTIYADAAYASGFPLLSMWYYEDASTLLAVLSQPSPEFSSVKAAQESFVRHAILYKTQLPVVHISPSLPSRASPMAGLSPTESLTPYDPYVDLFGHYNGSSPDARE